MSENKTAVVIDLDRERDVRAGLICAHCYRPDSETSREHELYCDDCLENWLYPQTVDKLSGIADDLIKELTCAQEKDV